MKSKIRCTISNNTNADTTWKKIINNLSILFIILFFVSNVCNATFNGNIVNAITNDSDLPDYLLFDDFEYSGYADFTNAIGAFGNVLKWEIREDIDGTVSFKDSYLILNAIVNDDSIFSEVGSGPYCSLGTQAARIIFDKKKKNKMQRYGYDVGRGTSYANTLQWTYGNFFKGYNNLTLRHWYLALPYDEHMDYIPFKKIKINTVDIDTGGRLKYKKRLNGKNYKTARKNMKNRFKNSLPLNYGFCVSTNEHGAAIFETIMQPTSTLESVFSAPYNANIYFNIFIFGKKECTMKVDWVIYIKDQKLTEEEIEALVKKIRDKG